MDTNELFIFEKLYQSYVMGGDVYSFQYKTENEIKINKYLKAIQSLEEKGYIKVVSQSEKRTRMSITDKGIDYAVSSLM